jgi:deazaflavin-dependent oxidoreductase (nitroreductase family)
VPLLYIEDAEHWAIVASNAGDDRDPAWWLNLKSHPDAAVQVGRRRFSVRAREATAQEANRLWPTLTASYRYYPDYRERTQREIPIVILERAS